MLDADDAVSSLLPLPCCHAVIAAAAIFALLDIDAAATPRCIMSDYLIIIDAAIDERRADKARAFVIRAAFDDIATMLPLSLREMARCYARCERC